MAGKLIHCGGSGIIAAYWILFFYGGVVESEGGDRDAGEAEKAENGRHRRENLKDN